MVHAIGKTLWRFLININIKLPEDIAILRLGIDPEKVKILKDSGSPVIMAALRTIAKTEQPRCRSTDERIRKRGYTDTKQHHSAVKKQSIMLCPALEKKVEMSISSEVRDTGRGISI